MESTEKTLEKYLQKTRSLPFLTRDEEWALARAWHTDKDVASGQKLVEAHLRLVVRLARRYRSFGVPAADLIAEGNIGILEALQRFDPELGHRFATYASYWIRAAMREHIVRSFSMVGAGANASRRRFLFRSGRPGRVAERDLALDAPVGDGSSTMLDMMASDQATQEEELADSELRASVGQALEDTWDDLDARERMIVERRLMAVGEDEASLADLGATLGVSRERVRQIETVIKKKIRGRVTAVSADLAADFE